MNRPRRSGSRRHPTARQPKRVPVSPGAGDTADRKRVEDELCRALAKADEGDQLLSALLDYVPEGITIADADQNLIRVSRHGQDLLGGPHAGRSAAEVAAEWKVFHPDGDTPMAVEDLPLVRAIVRGEVVKDVEIVQVNARGDHLQLLCSAGPVRDDAGRVVGGVVAWRDVSERKRAEDALRRAEEQLRLAMEAAQLGAFDFRPLTGEIFWDDRMKRIWGMAPEETPLSAGVLARIHPDDRERVLRTFDAALRPEGDGHYEAEFRIVRSGGSVRWASSRGRALFEGEREDRHVVRVVGVEQDVTERRQAEDALRRSEERLKLAQGSAGSGMWDWDMRSGKLEWSDELFRLFGLDPQKDEPTFDRWMSLVDPDCRALVHERIEAAIRERAALDSECRLVLPSGEVRWINALGRTTYDESGEPERMTGICLDVTARKSAEEEVRRANAKLVEADRRKNEFLAVLSHELRNPLAPIRNSLYVLDRAAPGGEQARRARQVIERQVGQLARLVDDLLDVTRIARNKIDLKLGRLDLGRLVLRTIEDHRAGFEKAGVRVDHHPSAAPVFVDGDESRLVQVVANLLQNAAKFTPAGGQVSVRVAADPGAGRALVRVADTGVGMTEEVLGRLFEPFSQADSTLDRSKGGLGLGLALARGLVDLHGGSVGARSAGPGHGSELTVSLPLAAPRTDSPGERSVAPETTRRRVLVIENNRDGANSLREMLELEGQEVEVAYNGRDGLAKARTFRPDLVLCDIGLPEMNGYQIARGIRADPELPSARLVALSGYALPEDLRRAREAGFDEHIAKPPRLEELRAVLRARDR
jgi:PAS domain S-box-containing protein